MPRRSKKTVTLPVNEVIAVRIRAMLPLQECLEDFREKTSCLHQFSESYIMTVRENIEIGDTKREISRQELEELGRKVGVDSNHATPHGQSRDR